MKRPLFLFLLALNTLFLSAQEAAFEVLVPKVNVIGESFKTFCTGISDGGFIVNPSIGNTLWKISEEGEVLEELEYSIGSIVDCQTYFCALLDIPDDPEHHLAVVLLIDWATETGNVFHVLKIDNDLCYNPAETWVVDLSDNVKLIQRGYPKHQRFNLEADGSISFATKAQNYDSVNGLLLARVTPSGEKTLGFFDTLCHNDYNYLTDFVPAGDSYKMVVNHGIPSDYPLPNTYDSYLNCYDVNREFDYIDSVFCFIPKYLDQSPLAFTASNGVLFVPDNGLEENHNTTAKLSDSVFVFPANLTVITASNMLFGAGLWKIDNGFNVLQHVAMSFNKKTDFLYCNNPVLFNGTYLYYCYTEHKEAWYSPRRTIVCKLDTDLNLIWQRWYGTEQGWYVITDMSLTNDGGAVLSGIGNTSCQQIDGKMLPYILKITADGYCSMKENSEPPLRPYNCYPNPVEDMLRLEYSPDVTPGQLELYDLQGRLLRTQNSSFETVNMENLPAGTYTLRVLLEDGTSYSDKVVKQ